MNSSAATMSMPTVEWRDLLRLTRGEKAWELTLSLPWLAGALWFYGRGQLVPGALCSFYFFLTGLRQSHGAQHYSLGVSKRAQDCVLFALSAAMLASMHAVQVSHLNHHRHCLSDNDAEGAAARWPWWRAILTGPWFVWRMHECAWRLAPPSKRRWIVAELCTAAAVIAVSLISGIEALRWHVLAMIIGECFTGFFAVWTVHHDCDSQAVARTQRGRWVNRLFYNMFFHAEHHLFPQVPTCHLDALADRLDAARSRVAQRQVIAFARC